MSTRQLRIGCEFVHVSSVEKVPALFQVAVHDPAGILDEAWIIEPGLDVHDYLDATGTRCRRLILPEGESLVGYYARVAVPDEWDEEDPDAEEMWPEDLPDDVLVYLLPSRYCESDKLGPDVWRLFGSLPRGWSRVLAVRDHVYSTIDYRTGSTGSWWSAYDVHTNGYGVCRDLAHLFVAYCRALNIPTRYVAGYLPDMDVEPDPAAMDFHAWTEVFLSGRWWTIDPRHGRRRKGHVPIVRGRDAADAAMVTAFGSPWLKRMTVFCDEIIEPIAWPPPGPVSA